MRDGRTKEEVLVQGGGLVNDGYLDCPADEIPREIMHARFLEHHARSSQNYGPGANDVVIDLLYGAAKEIRDLHTRLERAKEHSVRVEMVDFPVEIPLEMGEVNHGCRFIVGDDHVVAEWRGGGVSPDTVYVEGPALTYFKTTTPFNRCIRMVLEMAHWEIASAMMAGPGDGKLEQIQELKREVLGALGVGEIAVEQEKE